MPRCLSCGRRWLGSHGCAGAVAEVATADRPAAAPALPGYRVERLLGQGGFGVVVAATRAGAEGPVAVKIARPDEPTAAARLLREAEALAAIGPPHVPALVERGALADGTPFVAMELVAAPTLAEVMAERGPAEPALFAGVARGLLAALAAAHGRGIVHRDLKPENLFVVATGDGATIRMCDFGVARMAGAASLTSSGQSVGTIDYMAPEQHAGQPVDERTDLYAAGVILFELAAGRPPFFGDAAEVRFGHTSRRPPPLGELVAVAAGIEALVAALLAKSPDRRPSSAVAALAALDAALADAAPTSARATPAPALARASAKVARGLVFFRSRARLVDVQDAVTRLGAVLAHSAGDRHVAVLPDANPTRARRAAEALLAGITERARVSVETLAESRRGQRVHYLSPLFNRPESYPTDSEPAGITGAAVESDPDVVGRDAVLGELAAGALAALEQGSAGLATVIAEPGLGKSALARAITLRLGEGAVLLRAREPVGGEADETLRRLLDIALDLGGAADPRARAEALLGPELAATVWPAVALTLGLAGVDDTAVRALGAAPGVLRASVMRAAGEGLRARARARPLCLVVDDAHHADPATLDALEYATLAGTRAPLWICLLARPALAEARPALGDRAAAAARVALGPLAAADAAELCRRLLAPAEDIPAAAIERIVDRTRAIPLLLVELTRGLRRDGLVRRRERGEGWYLATDELDRLPDLPLVEWLAERDLGALPPDLAAHARLVAVLGGDPLPAEIEEVLAALTRADFPLDGGVATRQLLDRGLLVARGERVAFRHALVRDAAARAVPAELARRIHAAAAARPGVSPARLAIHLAGAGRAPEAARLTLELADAARDRHAYLDAEALYSRALELDPATRAHRGRALMRYRLGRHEDSLSDYQAARALADDGPLAVELALEEATARDWTMDFAGSGALVREVAERAGELPERVAAALLMARGRLEFREGRVREAVPLLREAAARARPLGLAGYETLIASLILLVLVHGMVLGELAEAHEAGREGMRLCEERSDAAHLIAILINWHAVAYRDGDVAGALAALRRAADLARQHGMVGGQLTAELNLAFLHYGLGELDDALASGAAAVALARRAGGPRDIVHVLVALIHAYDGRAAETAAALAAVDRAAIHPGDTLLVDIAELATRDAAAAEWDALRARCVGAYQEVELLEQRARAAHRGGRGDDARRLLAEALELAARHREPTTRLLRTAAGWKP